MPLRSPPVACRPAADANPDLLRAFHSHAPAAVGSDLWHFEAEQAFLELGGDAIAVHVLGQAEGPGEGAVAPLHAVEALRPAAPRLALAADRHLVPLDLDLDVVLVDAGELQLDLEALGGLVDVRRGDPARRGQARLLQTIPAQARLAEAVQRPV